MWGTDDVETLVHGVKSSGALESGSWSLEPWWNFSYLSGGRRDIIERGRELKSHVQSGRKDRAWPWKISNIQVLYCYVCSFGWPEHLGLGCGVSGNRRAGESEVGTAIVDEEEVSVECCECDGPLFLAFGSRWKIHLCDYMWKMSVCVEDSVSIPKVGQV